MKCVRIIADVEVSERFPAEEEALLPHLTYLHGGRMQLAGRAYMRLRSRYETEIAKLAQDHEALIRALRVFANHYAPIAPLSMPFQIQESNDVFLVCDSRNEWISEADTREDAIAQADALNAVAHLLAAPTTPKAKP